MTQFVPVESSNLAAIGFDPYKDDELLGVLSVKFKSGAVFQYFDVPAEKFDNFMDSPSKGKFYIANVKGAYDHEKVCDGEKTSTFKVPASKLKTGHLIERLPMRTGNIDL